MVVSDKRQYWENSLVGLDLLTVLLDPGLTYVKKAHSVWKLIGEGDERELVEKVLFSATRFLVPSLALAYKQPSLVVIEALQMRLLGFPMQVKLKPAEAWDDLVPPLDDEADYMGWLVSNADRVRFGVNDLEGCVSPAEHDRMVHLILTALDMSSFLSDRDVEVSSEEWDKRGILWTREVSLYGLLCHLAIPLVDEFVNVYPSLNRLEVIEALREGILHRIMDDMGAE